MNQSEGLRIRKFNPGTFQSDQEVIEQFVVRNHELDTVLDILRSNVVSPSCQHTLVVAPRGRGKTMLLARTAAELRVNDELSAVLMPVRFMEESQEIFNMADFWLETLFHLARGCERSKPELARELRNRHAALSGLWHNPALEEHARIAVLDAADRLGRRLVLMIENLQALYKDAGKDFGWKLRKVMQTEPQIVLVGSATSYFEGLDDPGQPFFELFRIIDLNPLNTDECRCLWAVVSGDSVGGREMRPLEILTGGSPRLLVIVAGFARHKSMRRLLEELVLLIDDHTEYFRGHLEALGKTERRVYLAVIDLWQLSTPSEISIRARMDIRKVSTMLGRLVERGAVVVDGSGRKRKYAAAERLYSIYYKLRRDRDEATVVQNLIRFMAVFYNEAEQKEAFSALIAEAADSIAIRAGLDRAVAESPEIAAVLNGTYPPGIERSPDSNAPVKGGQPLLESMAAFRKGDFERVIRLVDQALLTQSPDPSQLRESYISWALLMKATAQQKLGILDSSLSSIEEVIDRFGTAEDPELQEWVARALITKGDLLRAQGNPDSALSAFEEVIDRFDTTENQELQWSVAQALIDKGKVLQDQGNLEPALAAFEEVVDRFGSAEAPILKARVSSALAFKAGALALSNRLTASVSAFEKSIEIIDAVEPSKLPAYMALPLREMVATILMFKGTVQQVHGNLDAALSAFEEVVERFGTAEDPELQEQSVKALISKTQLQTKKGNVKDALNTYNELERRLRELNVQEKVELTWDTMRVGTQTLLAHGDPYAAVDSFRSLYAVFDPDNETMTREVLSLLIDLIAAGVATNVMLEIISSDDLREAALRPVIVALRLEAGEMVRAPGEVLEVAADLREDIRKARYSSGLTNREASDHKHATMQAQPVPGNNS